MNHPHEDKHFSVEQVEPHGRLDKEVTDQIINIFSELGEIDADDRPAIEQEIADDLERGDSDYVILRHEGKPIGMGITQLVPMKDDKAVAHIWFAGVSKPFRNTGAYELLAKQMKVALHQHAQRDGRKLVGLLTEGVRRGEAAFSKHGFKGVYLEGAKDELVEMPMISAPGSSVTIPDNPLAPQFKYLFHKTDGSERINSQELLDIQQILLQQYLEEGHDEYNSTVQEIVDFNRNFVTQLNLPVVLRSFRDQLKDKQRGVTTVGPAEFPEWLKKRSPKLHGQFIALLKKIDTINNQT